MREVLSWSVVVVAVFTVLQKHPLNAVMLRLVLSVLAVGVYTAFMAPDVALAEAMLGSLLTTFVYILMIRSPVRIRVGYVPVRILFEEHHWGLDGMFKEVVEKFARYRGYEVEYVRFENVEEMLASFESGYVDIACGPIVDRGFPILETKVFRLEDGREIDFLSMKEEYTLLAVESRDAFYTIPFSVEGFEEFMEEMRKSGELRRLVKKYAG